MSRSYRAAYSAAQDRIYLAESAVNSGNGDYLTNILLEEIGHSFDSILNPGGDSRGDEGELLQKIVTNNTLDDIELRRITQENDWREITVNQTTLRVEQNESISTATDLGTMSGTSASFRNSVSSSDTNDYYSIYLLNSGTLNLSMYGMSADADVALYNSSGSFITSSTRAGSSSESITRSLSGGTYYVRVYPYSSSRTNYTLSLNVQGGASDASNILSSTANSSNIGYIDGGAGSSNGSRSIVPGSVGGSDTSDYFRFRLYSSKTFSLTMNGMSSDADVQLLSSSGSVITSSTRAGSSSESITRSLSAGTYYVKVYPYSGSTSYNLYLNA